MHGSVLAQNLRVRRTPAAAAHSLDDHSAQRELYITHCDHLCTTFRLSPCNMIMTLHRTSACLAANVAHLAPDKRRAATHLSHNAATGNCPASQLGMAADYSVHMMAQHQDVTARRSSTLPSCACESTSATPQRPPTVSSAHHDWSSSHRHTLRIATARQRRQRKRIHTDGVRDSPFPAASPSGIVASGSRADDAPPGYLTTCLRAEFPHCKPGLVYSRGHDLAADGVPLVTPCARILRAGAMRLLLEQLL